VTAAWLRSSATGLWWAARAALPYALLLVERALDCLYILQLERYKPDRYGAWMRTHWRRVLPSWEVEIGLQVLVVGAGVWLAWRGVHGVVIYLLWVGAGHALWRQRLPLQMSQRLQWTSRAVRVSLATLLVGAVVVGASIVFAGLFPSVLSFPFTLLLGGMGGLAAAGIIAPVVVFIPGYAVLPLERSIARKFLGQAERRMRAYRGRVIGITGSYGKTTTKLIVADLLASRYRVLKTPAGVNTTMGITRVIREELRDEHEYFVVEVSAYGPGEIREVCDIVHPSLGILTAVGVQHLERFGTPEAIAEAKYELLHSLPPGGTAVVNADDPVCLRLAGRAESEGKRVLRYGFGEAQGSLALRGTDLEVSARGTRFRVVSETGETVTFDTRLLGRWNISNILAGLVTGRECGVPLHAMREAVAGLSSAPRRLEIREEGGITRILDVANANPRGAQMALEVLAQFTGGSRILITPGMVELGSVEAEENRRFGQSAASVCDYVILVGPEQTRPIREGLKERGFPADRILTARHADEVADRLAGIVRPGDILLFENRLPDTYLEVGT
jgi:UDP-N-acetylmuramoyl-tripeptide--D-alanyl-D-alanine ligase